MEIFLAPPAGSGLPTARFNSGVPTDGRAMDPPPMQ